MNNFICEKTHFKNAFTLYFLAVVFSVTLYVNCFFFQNKINVYLFHTKLSISTDIYVSFSSFVGPYETEPHKKDFTDMQPHRK